MRKYGGLVADRDIRRTVDAVWRMEAAKIVATLTRVVGDVGVAEDLAADLLRRHVPAVRGRSLPFIGMFEGVPGAPSVAELERRLEDGEDPGFGR